MLKPVIITILILVMSSIISDHSTCFSLFPTALHIAHMQPRRSPSVYLRSLMPRKLKLLQFLVSNDDYKDSKDRLPSLATILEVAIALTYRESKYSNY